MSIVTKTGDKGETGLFGGDRVAKDATRIQAYGTVDELNALLGVVLSQEAVPLQGRRQVETIQHLLFRLGADLATPQNKTAKQDRINADHIAEMEMAIAELEKMLPEQTAFLLPGGCRASAFLHLARTVCRRAERHVVKLRREEEINVEVIIFLNRLSDYLFLLARKVNIEAGVAEEQVRYE
jgi:cob(I)alamin adenosyltransferase